MSVPNPKSTADFRGSTHSLRTNMYYKGDIVAQYTLGDVVGIETALLNSYLSFTTREIPYYFLSQTIAWGQNIETSSYQIPIQLLYIVRLRTHPNMRIKFTGGIALDWITSVFLYRQYDPLFVPSLLCGARIKSSTGKYGHME